MKKIKLLNNEIEIEKVKQCSLNKNSQLIEGDYYVNLYIRIGNSCQCNCEFCIAPKDKDIEFDIYKLFFVINQLKAQKIRINKISLTGGEPLMEKYIKTVENIVNIIKQIDSKIFLIINTNGINLKLLSNKSLQLIDSISISVHHYDVIKNNNIFQNNTSNLSKYEEWIKKKIHISCNLIKGYIDSEKEVLQFIKVMQDNGFYDIGFVNLMKHNKYCAENFIDFKNFDIEKIGLIKQRELNNGEDCRCANYIYFNEDYTKFTKIYYRYYSGNSKDNTFVYDMNVLKKGFNGKEIEL